MLQAFLSDGRMREFLTQARTIAVVGAKDKEGQPVDRVGSISSKQATKDPGPPHTQRRVGLQTYPSLAEVPFPVDIINVFRAPQYCPDHARETVALSPLPQLFWMQQGIVSPEAASIVGKAGIAVVEDLCIMVEHKRLLGN